VSFCFYVFDYNVQGPVIVKIVSEEVEAQLPFTTPDIDALPEVMVNTVTFCVLKSVYTSCGVGLAGVDCTIISTQS
jgi:hypothetical protein